MNQAQFSMAKRMINASICSYQIHSQNWTPGSGSHPPVLKKVEGSKDSYFYNVVPEYQDDVGFVGTAESGYVPLFTADGTDKINAALVGAMDDGNLVLSIRGTIPPSISNNNMMEWIRDWAQDADIVPSPWSIHQAPQTSIANVETGFAKAMLSLWPDIMSMIDQTLQAHNCTGIVIAGHSKGASMTFLAATLIQQHYPQFKGKIEVHAFAAAVTGDEGFKSDYDALGLDASTHRYQVANDLVPFLPLWTSADFYTKIDFSKWEEELAWAAFFLGISEITHGGYEAVGDFTYFDERHSVVSGAIVQQSALPTVAKTFETMEFTKIADAHSAVNSYRPCFDTYRQ